MSCRPAYRFWRWPTRSSTTKRAKPTCVRRSGSLPAFPVVVAAWHRIRNGLEPLPPDERLSHAANFLWQLHGVKPDAEMARDLDVCLVLHADHTFNASTFACREVVSTRAHMYAGGCRRAWALCREACTAAPTPGS